MDEPSAAPAQLTHPVVFYDGECPFCLRSVSILLEHDREARLRFARLQGVLAHRLLSEEERRLGPESSVVLFEPGVRPRLSTRSEAMVRALAYLPYPWRLAGTLRSVPSVFPLLDIVYRAIARRRGALLDESGVCEIPERALRERFID